MNKYSQFNLLPYQFKVLAKEVFSDETKSFLLQYSVKSYDPQADNNGNYYYYIYLLFAFILHANKLISIFLQQTTKSEVMRVTMENGKI